MSGYWNPDGVNSILQWTAEPLTDTDLITEDAVTQQFSTFDITKFRSYSRIDVANAMGAIEGTIAFDHFLDHPSVLNDIDLSGNGIISAFELQFFIDAAPGSGVSPVDQAFARLLGGTSSASAFRRTDFFDRVDGTSHGGIRIAEIPGLAANLLPGPDAFPITGRIEAADQGYLLSPNTNRNWLDLTLHDPGTDFWQGPIPSQFVGKSPQELNNPLANVFFNPIDDPPPPGSEPECEIGGGEQCISGALSLSSGGGFGSILAATTSSDTVMGEANDGGLDLAYAPSTGNAVAAATVSTDVGASSSESNGDGTSETSGEGEASLDLALLELTDELALGGLVDPLA